MELSIGREADALAGDRVEPLTLTAINDDKGFAVLFGLIGQVFAVRAELNGADAAKSGAGDVVLHNRIYFLPARGCARSAGVRDVV